MAVGRKEELGLLESKYKSARFEFGYLYGQRRIGKTTLVEMLSEGKKALTFYATDSDDGDLRASFSRDFAKQTGLPFGGRFDSWFDFFLAIADYFGEEEGLFVIDEYPNIVLTRDGKRKSTDFPSALQKAIDLRFIRGKSTLLLTGSNVSFIEKEIGDTKAPLYERNTFELKLFKFEWEDACLALNGINDDWEKARILAITGTFPYYISLIDQKKSARDNLRMLFFDRTATFTDDPSKVITSDIATGGLYASILSAISEGVETVTGLADRFETDTSKISKYLSELVDCGVLRRATDFRSERNVYYRIDDPMLAFYYRFIWRDAEWIRRGNGLLIETEYDEQIERFIEKRYESVCMDYLQCLNKKGLLPAFFRNFQNLRIEHSKLGRSIEIDIVAEAKNVGLIAECKFSKNPKGVCEYKSMVEDCSVPPLSALGSIDYFLFSASGFSEGLIGLRDQKLHLVDLKTMFTKL